MPDGSAEVDIWYRKGYEEDCCNSLSPSSGRLNHLPLSAICCSFWLAGVDLPSICGQP